MNENDVSWYCESCVYYPRSICDHNYPFLTSMGL